jgi:DNA-binding NarL/FixJ family response regulator
MRVFVADGHPLVLAALRQVIGDQPDLTLVGAAGSEVALFASPALAQSEVLVVDLSLGKELIERAHAAAPHLVIVAHSILPRDPFEAAALRAGAAAFVAKGDHPAALLRAIRHRPSS